MTPGWRRVEVTERRRKQEFAEAVRRIAEEDYPEAGKIRLVVDNLSTHTAAAFYEAFPPEQVRGLSRRVELVYTPVHGSWLNMAEIEISALVRQCLGKRRLPDEETLRREVETWQEERNRLSASVRSSSVRITNTYPSPKMLPDRALGNVKKNRALKTRLCELLTDMLRAS